MAVLFLIIYSRYKVNHKSYKLKNSFNIAT